MAKVPSDRRKILAALILLGAASPAAAGPCDGLRYGIGLNPNDVRGCIIELQAQISTLQSDMDTMQIARARRLPPSGVSFEVVMQIIKNQCLIARDLRALRGVAKAGAGDADGVCDNLQDKQYVKPD